MLRLRLVLHFLPKQGPSYQLNSSLNISHVYPYYVPSSASAIRWGTDKSSLNNRPSQMDAMGCAIITRHPPSSNRSIYRAHSTTKINDCFASHDESSFLS